MGVRVANGRRSQPHPGSAAMADSDDAVSEYGRSLSDLTNNNKPMITMLTLLAEESQAHADKIVATIEAHIKQVDVKAKLPALFLVDSIIKNAQPDVCQRYKRLFAKNIADTCAHILEQGDEMTKRYLFKTVRTWHDSALFPPSRLYMIDVKCNELDAKWPITQPHHAPAAAAPVAVAPPPVAQSPPPPRKTIHVNPNFIANPPRLPASNNNSDVDEARLAELQRKREELNRKLKSLNASKAGSGERPHSIVAVPQQPPALSSRDPRQHRVAAAAAAASSGGDRDDRVKQKDKGKKERSSEEDEKSKRNLSTNDATPKDDQTTSTQPRSKSKERSKSREPTDQSKEPPAAARETSAEREARKLKKERKRKHREKRAAEAAAAAMADKDERTKANAAKKLAADGQEASGSGQAAVGAAAPPTGDVDMRRNLPTIPKIKKVSDSDTSAAKRSASSDDVSSVPAKKSRDTPPAAEPSTSGNGPDIALDDGQRKERRLTHGGFERRGQGRYFQGRGGGRGTPPIASTSSSGGGVASLAPTAVPGSHAFAVPPTCTPQTQVPSTSAPSTSAAGAHRDCLLPAPPSSAAPTAPPPPPAAPDAPPSADAPPQTARLPLTQPHVPQFPGNQQGLLGDPIPANNRIFVDNRAYEVFFIQDTPVIEREGQPHRVYFTGPARNVVIDGVPYPLGFGEQRDVVIDGHVHSIRFGAPSRELYLGNYPFRGAFGGPPIYATINGVRHEIRLGGPPPEVKIEPEPCLELLRFMPQQRRKPVMPTMPNLTGVNASMFGYSGLSVLGLQRPQIGAPLLGMAPSIWPQASMAPNPPLCMAGVMPPQQPQVPAVCVAAPVVTTATGSNTPTAQPQPQPQPQMDILSLMNNLTKAGLLPKKSGDPTAQTQSSGKSPQRPATPPIIPCPQPDEMVQKEHAPPAHLKEFSMRALKVRYESVIEALYNNALKRCSICGLRLMEPQYDRHLDWHFKENIRMRDVARAKSQAWFLPIDDWVRYTEEGEDPISTAKSLVFEATASSKNGGGDDQSEAVVEATAGDSGKEECAVCGETFETFWDEDAETWKLRNAVRADGKLYHPSCVGDVSLAAGLSVSRPAGGFEDRDDHDEDPDVSDYALLCKLQSGASDASAPGDNATRSVTDVLQQKETDGVAP